MAKKDEVIKTLPGKASVSEGGRAPEPKLPQPSHRLITQEECIGLPKPVALGLAQEADQRLSLPLPACTMRTIEVTIIERASLSWLRPLSSEWSTRSAALVGAPLARRLAGERNWWGARESKAAQQANPRILAKELSKRWPLGESLMRRVLSR